MKEITVLFKISETPVEEKINRELCWYDTVKKEMIILSGGKLDFEYKKDDYLVKMGNEEKQRRGITSVYRLLPKASDVVVKNYNKIKVYLFGEEKKEEKNKVEPVANKAKPVEKVDNKKSGESSGVKRTSAKKFKLNEIINQEVKTFFNKKRY